MADIPDELVARGVEHVVQCNSELDHPEPGAEMAARHRHGIDRLGAQLVRHLFQLALLESAQAGGVLDRLKHHVSKLMEERTEGTCKIQTTWPGSRGQSLQIINVTSPERFERSNGGPRHRVTLRSESIHGGTGDEKAMIPASDRAKTTTIHRCTTPGACR